MRRAAIGDQTLPQRVRAYARIDLGIIDEFGFDKIERAEAPQAASLLSLCIHQAVTYDQPEQPPLSLPDQDGPTFGGA